MMIGRPSPSICLTRSMSWTGSTSRVATPEGFTGTPRDPTPRTRPDTSHIRARTVPSPLHPPAPGVSSQRSPPSPPGSALFCPSPTASRLRLRSKSSTRSTRPTTSKSPTKRWNGSPISTTAARHREYHDVVDKIIASGEEILAYHPGRRASNGPLEGINNLHPGPTTRAHGFTNYDNYAARGLLVS